LTPKTADLHIKDREPPRGYLRTIADQVTHNGFKVDGGLVFGGPGVTGVGDDVGKWTEKPAQSQRRKQLGEPNN